MSNQGDEIGLIGLGTMGRNFALNLADHNFPVAVYNRTGEKTREFMEKEVAGRDIRAGYALKEFVGLLRRPRALLLLVSAGAAVDALIEELLPYLEAGDLIIDSGNSHFTDTERRSRSLAGRGLRFMGLGISGGERGARYGPSLMPGGPPEAYERVRPLFEAAAARVNGEPCVAYLGPRSAGHYVKMVHNGIEYGVMELLAEAYDLMKRGLGLNPAEMAEIFAGWNRGELASYLVGITARIFLQKDEKTGQPLIEVIMDQAKQKGTGMWTSWDAMDLQAPTPTIDTAVIMRDLSGYKTERLAAAARLKGPARAFKGDRGRFISRLNNALYAAMVLTYVQGLALLAKASDAYGYHLDLEAVTRIWRGGCIIRAALLEELRAAFKARADLPNLLQDPGLGRRVMTRQGALREVVGAAARLGLPAPGLMASLAYFDAYRSGWLPANLIQAQRDFFGAHTYERVDVPGVFHTEWEEDE
jgi:6-phosphogluconate dehydrogenase